MVFIRPYQSSDFEDTATICRETLPPSLSSSSDAYRLAPYLWTHQYTHLSPATCLVLDDGTGRAVGYCIGCPSIPDFVSRYDEYVRSVLTPSTEIQRPEDIETKQEPWMLPVGSANGVAMAQQAYNPKWLLLEGNEDVTGDGYTATMHIDLLEGWRSGGWGRKLIEEFVSTIRAAKAAAAQDSDFKGIWIGIAADNAQVVKFYEKVGFKLYPTAPDKGPRMVMDL